MWTVISFTSAKRGKGGLCPCCQRAFPSFITTNSSYCPHLARIVCTDAEGPPECKVLAQTGNDRSFRGRSDWWFSDESSLSNI